MWRERNTYAGTAPRHMLRYLADRGLRTSVGSCESGSGWASLYGSRNRWWWARSSDYLSCTSRAVTTTNAYSPRSKMPPGSGNPHPCRFNDVRMTALRGFRTRSSGGAPPGLQGAYCSASLIAGASTSASSWCPSALMCMSHLKYGFRPESRAAWNCCLGSTSAMPFISQNCAKAR